MIYLDNNATTRPADEVVEAAVEIMRDQWGNPSSVHRFGQLARQRLELARQSVARLLGATPREIVLTGGGTEAANLAIRGSVAVQPDRRVIVTSRLEHSAVREQAESLARDGVEVVWVDHDDDGLVVEPALTELLEARAAEIAVVSIMWANNETGVVQPIDRLARLCRDHRVRFHTDATQWVGRMPVDLSTTPIDLLTCSAHKFHGPKGVGALRLSRGVRVAPQIVGGPHERQLRGGTENVAAIVGMGVAADLAAAWIESRAATEVAALRDAFEERILATVDRTTVNGGAAPRLWNTSNIAFDRLEAEAILLLLSERGVSASAGAACSSGSLDPSPVLLAMGVPPSRAHGSIRFSLSRETTAEEVDRAAEIVTDVIARLRRSMPTAAS